MAEFTPITTQEQFDAAIGARIQRERDTLAKKYADYEDLKTQNGQYETQLGELTKSMAESAKKYAGYDKQLADLNGKVKGYETNSVKMRIAHETGLPYELAARLSGSTEEEIRADAKSFAQFLQKPAAAPLASTEPGGAGSQSAAYRALANKLTQGE